MIVTEEINERYMRDKGEKSVFRTRSGRIQIGQMCRKAGVISSLIIEAGTDRYIYNIHKSNDFCAREKIFVKILYDLLS